MPGLKVIGTSLPRTGTMSLRNALNGLGLPCFHGYNGISDWNASNTESFWKNVYANNGKNINYSDFYEYNGYQSCCDSPSVYYWKDIMKYYNNDIKIILAIRDHEKLYKSWETVLKVFFDGHSTTNVSANDLYVNMCVERVFNGKFFTFDGSNQEKQSFIELATEWNNNVINYVNENNLHDKFLLIDLENNDTITIMKDLCTFLDINYNESTLKEFPIDNKTKDFQKNYDDAVRVSNI